MTLAKVGPIGIARIMSTDWENGIKPQFRNNGQVWSVNVPLAGAAEDRCHSVEETVTS